MNSKILVLYYHRIYDKKNDMFKICVSPENFEQQIRFLKTYYDILRFEDDWENANKDSVVITFDDGYADNYENALPILENLKAPATMFITTGILGGEGEFWWDELETALLKGDTFPLSFKLEDQRYKCTWDTSSYKKRVSCALSLHYLMKNNITVEQRKKWLKQIWKWRDTEYFFDKENTTLTEEMCKKIAESPYITVGCHTVTHPSLARLSEENQLQEIKDSKEQLEKLLGRKIETMSYPFGVKNVDYNEITKDICHKVGIRKAAAVETGIWTPKCSPLEIPRNIVLDWDLYTFKKKIKEYFRNQ